MSDMALTPTDLPTIDDKWLPADELLIAHYAALPMRWTDASELLGQRLGRSGKAIRSKADRMGIEPSDRQLSKEEAKRLVDDLLIPAPGADR